MMRQVEVVAFRRVGFFGWDFDEMPHRNEFMDEFAVFGREFGIPLESCF